MWRRERLVRGRGARTPPPRPAPPRRPAYPGDLLLLVLLHGQEAGTVDGHHDLLQGGQQLPGLLALAVRERPSARQGPGAGPSHAPVTIAAPATAPSAFLGNGPPTWLGQGLGPPREPCWQLGLRDSSGKEHSPGARRAQPDPGSRISPVALPSHSGLRTARCGLVRAPAATRAGWRRRGRQA